MLKFSTINSREEGIDEAYAETCSWVFSGQSTGNGASTKPCEFMPWLRSSEPFFWISGKAGCGKSTLMKYVYHNPKTKAELEHSPWADRKDLILVGYFFYDRGNNDQKSREGMLRSILHQVLSTRRDLIPMVFSPWRFFDDEYLRNPKPKLEIPAEFLAWPSLSGAFISMLDHLRDSRICLFLDGLDEYRMIGRENEYTEEELDLIYDGNNEDEAWGRSTWITDGHKEIAQFLRNFKIRGNVKVCISSRELVVFEHEFRSFPRIMVHTHTAEAIAKYCQGRLTKEAPDLVDLSKFVSTITDRSFGVFLWVQLVVDLLVDGYAKGNYPEELWETMKKIPPRLGGKNGLYMHMMRNIEPEYLLESKKVFQLVMRWSDIGPSAHLDIITLFLAVQGHLRKDSTQNLRASSDDYQLKTWDEWEDRWKNLQKRLKSRCGGLLEGTEKVQFMHQTAKQFVSRKYLWPTIFRNAVGFTTESDMDLALMSGLVRRLKCCSEAVVTHNSLSTDPEAKKTRRSMALKLSRGKRRGQDMIYDPYPGVKVSEVGCGILEAIVYLARYNTLHQKSADNFHHHCARLLDELDHVGVQLTSALRVSKDVMDSGWPGAYLLVRDHDGCLGMRVRTFLDLAILTGITAYVETKVRERKFSKDELTYLLLRATQTQRTRWRWKEYEFNAVLPSIELVESLLQEGADPNSRDAISNVAMIAREGWTAWISFLQQGIPSFCSSWTKYWEARIAITKLFLKYGADTGVRWYQPVEDGLSNIHAGTITTPETALRKHLSRNHQFKEDLDELLEILRQVNEKSVTE